MGVPVHASLGSTAAESKVSPISASSGRPAPFANCSPMQRAGGTASPTYRAVYPALAAGGAALIWRPRRGGAMIFAGLPRRVRRNGPAAEAQVVRQHREGSALMTREEVMEQLGSPYTNKVVPRLHKFAFIPDKLLDKIAREALSEHWGKNHYVLEKYLAIHVPWSIEQGRFTQRA